MIGSEKFTFRFCRFTTSNLLLWKDPKRGNPVAGSCAKAEIAANSTAKARVIRLMAPP